MARAGPGGLVRRADQLRRELARDRRGERHARRRNCCAARSAAPQPARATSSARRWRSPPPPRSPSSARATARFAAIGVASIAGLCGLFALLGLAHPPGRARHAPPRRADHPAGHCRARPARRGDGAAGGVARARADDADRLVGRGVEHPCRDRHQYPAKGPGPVPGRYPARGRAAARGDGQGANFPAANCGWCPSLRGPVTALNGVPVSADEGDPRRRVDPARRPRADLRRATCRPPTRSSRASGGRPTIAARRWSASTSMPRPRSGSRSATA